MDVKGKTEAESGSAFQLIFGFFKKSGVEYAWDDFSAIDTFHVFDPSGLQKSCIQKYSLLIFR